MDPAHRSPSPSAPLSNIARRTPSPAPHGQHLGHSSAFTAGSVFANPQHSPYLDPVGFGASQQSQLFPQQNAFAQNSLFQDQPGSTAQFEQDSNLFEFGGLDNGSGINGGFDGPLFPSNDAETDFLNPNALDPRLLESHDPSADLHNSMAQMHAHSPTPPHMLSAGMHPPPSSSPHGSPGMNQGGFQPSPAHSRHASLDPASAAYPQMQGWNSGNDAFRGHRRAPSDAHSDVSSAQPSPYLTTADSFEHPINNHSPMLGAQQDPSLYQDVVAPMDHFSLTQAQNPYISPAHSPIPSPQLIPQQHPLPAFTSADSFGLQGGMVAPMPIGYNGMQGFGILASQNRDQFPEFGQNNGDMSNNMDAMSPPEINIQLAPPSRQASFEPPKPEGLEDEILNDGLSPPDRSEWQTKTLPIG